MCVCCTCRVTWHGPMAIMAWLGSRLLGALGRAAPPAAEDGAGGLDEVKGEEEGLGAG